MARIRTVKPEIYENEELSEVSEAAFILSIGLLNHADDEGYFKANPLLIRNTVFPLREPSVSIHDALIELSEIGYIELFIGSDGKKYGLIINFLKHQKINRPTPSKIKELCLKSEASLNTHGALTAGKERKGKEQGKEDKKETTNVVPKKETDPPEEKPPEKPKRGTRLADNWEPTLADTDFAKMKGLNDERIASEALKFRNYWTSISGSKATKLDWHRTWQNWIIRSDEGGRASGSGSSSGQRSSNLNFGEIGARVLSRAQDKDALSQAGRP